MASHNSESRFTMSTFQAAAQTGYSDEGIRNLIRSGKLEAVRKIDGRYRLDPAQVSRLAEARRALQAALSA